MHTKERILDEALTLFAEKGYANVFVAEIAEAVGIKAPSLYKHYKSKQEIFDAILAKMKQTYDDQSAALHMDGNNATADAAFFSGLPEDQLVQTGMGLFHYFLHDGYVRKFRKMLTVEQFRNAELAALFTKQYADDPLSYQASMFAMLSASGALKDENPDVTAMQFYAPMFLALTICDRHPEREAAMCALIEQHIRQFAKLYSREDAS